MTVELEAREQFNSVRADWHDIRAGYRKHFIAGEGSPVFQIKGVLPDETRAVAAAEGKLCALRAREMKLNISLPGLPGIEAAQRFNMVDGLVWLPPEWITKTVTHKITASQGYMMSIDGDFPVDMRNRMPREDLTAFRLFDTLPVKRWQREQGGGWTARSEHPACQPIPLKPETDDMRLQEQS